MGALSSLETLFLFGNQLIGTIPAELGALSSLEFLELEFNNLSGSMPSDVCNLRTTNGGLLRFLLWRLTAKVRLYVLAARSVCEKILLWMLTAKVRLFTSTSSNMLCK
uniref:Uncharacterized protein n=1 Tax=Ditylum brightwellii TaxID=49249 RepID=A0A7S4VYJ4_9STRA